MLALWVLLLAPGGTTARSLTADLVPTANASLPCPATASKVVSYGQVLSKIQSDPQERIEVCLDGSSPCVPHRRTAIACFAGCLNAIMNFVTGTGKIAFKFVRFDSIPRQVALKRKARTAFFRARRECATGSED
jgi:hypothetical protein